jgi:hypothetical protein
MSEPLHLLQGTVERLNELLRRLDVLDTRAVDLRHDARMFAALGDIEQAADAGAELHSVESQRETVAREIHKMTGKPLSEI